MMRDLNAVNEEAYANERLIDKERWEVLAQLEDWLETPMVIMGFAWLALLVIEFTSGLSPFLKVVGVIIWIIFILDFLLKFILAPEKLVYLKDNWLTVIALAVPALRVFRILTAFRLLRVARAARGLRLVRVITSLNRGMRALGAAMGRRGFGYVLALSLAVMLSGAAGMYAFENEVQGGLTTYGEALWWTAMLLTSIGSEYWPQTPEGRALCFILSLYGFAVFGYMTATLATFFIGRDAESDEGELAGANSLEALRVEIAALRAEVSALRQDKTAG
jgi:voltage-gated potassium channel